jgi:hypothetical protein
MLEAGVVAHCFPVGKELTWESILAICQHLQFGKLFTL